MGHTKNLEERVEDLEGVLAGTLDAPGLVHVQQEIAKTVYGSRGENGLVKDVEALKLAKAKGMAWVAGAAAAGAAFPTLLEWIKKLLHP